MGFMKKPRSISVPVATVIGTVCVLVAGLTQGSTSASSAAVGAVMAIVFFASTGWIVGPIAAVMPQFSLAAAMIFYLTKVALLLALFVLLTADGNEANLVDRQSLGITVLVISIGWIVTRTVDAFRERVPIYDLPNDES